MDEKTEMEQGIIETAEKHPESAKAQFLKRVVTGDAVPTEVEIINMLDVLVELEAERAVVAGEWAPEIAKLQAYQDGACEEIDEQIASLKAEIKSATVNHGTSVKGARLQACFTKPRIKWDDKALCGYATAGHSELFAFRKEGKESCSIRVRR